MNEIHINNYSHSEIYDFIVIGSGPAGSISALNIQKKGKKVLLIDEGGYYQISSKKHPASEFYNKWRNGGIISSLFPNQVSFSSGIGLGGGSEINSGLLHYPTLGDDSRQLRTDWTPSREIPLSYFIYLRTAFQLPY